MVNFWNPQRVEDRAKSMRSEAEADKRIADMRIQFAVTLEDIAIAWARSCRPGQEWLSWGKKYKCPVCGAVREEKTRYCPACGVRFKEGEG